MRLRLAFSFFLILASAPPAPGQERPGPGRVDFFTPGSRRAGYAVVDPASGRADFYDTRSRRAGYGKTGGGQMERFDLRSRRTGQGRTH